MEIPMREAGPEFDESKYQEILDMYNTGSVEDVPENSLNTKNMVTCRWVCTMTFDDFGKLLKLKARLTARGCQDKDKDLITATVTPHKESCRIVLHIFAQLQWRARKWDAKKAFLHSGRRRKWTRDVTVKPPKEAYQWGIVKEGWIWRLLRALYGLGDGPIEWTLEVHLILLDAGFVQSKCDLSLYWLYLSLIHI